ncbi:CopD family protein [Parasphingopyxis sp.]|uniref:CopD family protein n=1 Tax=Parasphingopyxis sp. TaxID=1920299 RepID=UPI0026159BE6|nr:CopD family protein [Parasphingopyxis sp.]
MIYLWLKAAHVASVLLFVGGTLALLLAGAALGTRQPGDAEQAQSLRAMVRWWDARITAPAMIAAWALGIWLAMSGDWFSNSWLQVKLLLVILLSGLHGMLSGRLRRFDALASPAAAKPPMIVSFLTLGCVLGISILAVVKPG